MKIFFIRVIILVLFFDKDSLTCFSLFTSFYPLKIEFEGCRVSGKQLSLHVVKTFLNLLKLLASEDTE